MLKVSMQSMLNRLLFGGFRIYNQSSQGDDIEVVALQAKEAVHF